MTLTVLSGYPLLSSRFVLRPLTLADVTPRYLSWLHDTKVQRWIHAANSLLQLEDLERYVRDRTNRDDVLFLGIFSRESGLHVGNIKFEPIDRKAQSAVLGVLIGDPAYRGQGVFGEVLEVAAAFLSKAYGVRQIMLGVRGDNEAAVKAYRASGFVEEGTPSAEGDLWMVLHV